MRYNRCGTSGLKLPALSLGLWHNFGGIDPEENGRAMLHAAFDAGITHFDLANNYGPPPGSAEETFGRIMKRDLAPFRNEMVISSKAGFVMWPGPYGTGGTRKYLVSSLDDSLKRMNLDYVDIFYHHRPDPDTPLEETMAALDYIVRSGRAHYVGISNYSAAQTRRACTILNELKTPCIIHQQIYSMFNRGMEADRLLDTLDEFGAGCITFSPLAQGLLTQKYLSGIPEGSRAAKERSFLKREAVTPERVDQARRLAQIAQSRGQTLAQMAVVWILRLAGVTSVLVGASSPQQIQENIDALKTASFTKEELENIESILENKPA